MRGNNRNMFTRPGEKPATGHTLGMQEFTRKFPDRFSLFLMSGYPWLLSLFFLFSAMVKAQPKEYRSRDFFNDERIIQLTISTDIRNLLAEKKNMGEVPALMSFRFPDSTSMEQNIKLRPRGHFRKENCYLSSLTLLFNNNNPANKMAGLKTMKMVSGCGRTASDDQYLLKEYMIYKMYNHITDFSFRVRLLHVTYVDTKKKVKAFSQYAFLLEDADEVAKRNNHQQKKNINFSPKGTSRHQTTLMCVFQYMIGNTDWSIPNYHNIRLVVPRQDTNHLPLPIPYDFDMSGAVNPPYAGTSPIFDIEKVTDRLYRGFAVSGPEIDKVINVFLEKEKHIMYSLQEFALLDKKHKNEMMYFLTLFFTEIKNKAKVVNIFIKNARSN